MECGKCGSHGCFKGNTDKLPKDCPSKEESTKEKLNDYITCEENENIALNAARTESEGYKRWTRLEEIIQFSKKAGYNKLGLAFCVGLNQEAKKTVRILEDHGFEVISLICKMGAVPKEDIGLEDKEKVNPGNFEPICNPIAQAEIFNEKETDFNVILGLCVGHDSLLIKHSKAPVTTFAVKDRALGHNPLAAIYCDFYMKSRFQ
ncbi:DUF1847 domain-containing protein [Natranaerofaba carboxydovora]|uniref:DUF1847 domain-containing protein n=1 Tax=Natranaerofaba carboxydovora TaxID=2742683 RepID=UPI001F12EEE4|nr:DUF1847 domain-containing protein [Natranaerofaba carboxydovora]UMZ74622.1 hypothetical protein ACONDI_02221 [Natranaerofaba carboxydovora]